MASKSKKTDAIAAPVAPKTPAEILAEMDQIMGHMADSSRKEVAAEVAKKRSAYEEMAECLTAPGDPKDIQLSRLYRNLHWGMGNAAVESGRLAVYAEFRAILAELKGDHDAPADVAAAFLDCITRQAITDVYRRESSTNPYSNALAADEGEGRGMAYRDLEGLARHYLGKLNEAR